MGLLLWDEAYGTTIGSNSKSGIEDIVKQQSKKFESQNPHGFLNFPAIPQVIDQENTGSSPPLQIASSSQNHIEDCNVRERSTLEFEFQEDEEAECLKRLQEDLVQGRRTQRSWRT